MPNTVTRHGITFLYNTEHFAKDAMDLLAKLLKAAFGESELTSFTYHVIEMKLQDKDGIKICQPIDAPHSSGEEKRQVLELRIRTSRDHGYRGTLSHPTMPVVQISTRLLSTAKCGSNGFVTLAKINLLKPLRNTPPANAPLVNHISPAALDLTRKKIPPPPLVFQDTSTEESPQASTPTEDELLLCLNVVFEKFGVGHFSTDELDEALMSQNGKCDVSGLTRSFSGKTWLEESMDGPAGSMQISAEGKKALEKAGLISGSGERISPPVPPPLPQPPATPIASAPMVSTMNDLFSTIERLQAVAKEHSESIQKLAALNSKRGSLRGELGEVVQKIKHLTEQHEKLVAEESAVAAELAEIEIKLKSPEMKKDLEDFAQIQAMFART